MEWATHVQSELHSGAHQNDVGVRISEPDCSAVRKRLEPEQALVLGLNESAWQHQKHAAAASSVPSHEPCCPHSEHAQRITTTPIHALSIEAIH